MKINTTNNFLAFQKRLVATGAYKKGGESKPCFFYKLNKDEDFDYLKDIFQSDSWQDAELSEAFIENLIDYSNDEFYTIENEKAQCLGFAEIYCENAGRKNTKSLHLIETCPQYATKNKNRQNKYIGESLISFITKLAKKEKKEMVYIPAVFEEAAPFYEDKCFFQKEENKENDFLHYHLNADDYDLLIKQNEKHTGTEIKFV